MFQPQTQWTPDTHNNSPIDRECGVGRHGSSSQLSLMETPRTPETLRPVRRLRRLRRLRRSAEIRDLVAETDLRASRLIQPLFVIDGSGETEPIESMPGQKRFPLGALADEARRLSDLGLGGIALFPRIDPALKSLDASEALNPNTLILRAISTVKAARPAMPVFADIALDPYTSHGHDGLLSEDGSCVLNDASVDVLAEMAVRNAEAGADFVAPSDMMDGRVAAIRHALDIAGFNSTGILAYSAKFNSAFYGPFRDAVGSASAAGTSLLDKAGYQLDPRNRRQALTEALLDEAEGADILLVKPAGPYLDIIRDIRERSDLPLAAYQVSGEYAQLHAASRLGWLDLKRTRDESIYAILRAGASLILTYFASGIAAEHSRSA